MSNQSEIHGIIMVQPENKQLSLEARDRASAIALLEIVEMRGCPQRVCTSEQTKQWIHPFLLQRYQLQREYDQAVLINSCSYSCRFTYNFATSQLKA